ncbi:CUB domain-containing protein 1-like [Genypterus blacodes]|uniref:CUB domain-containing protein 1-like n=1 Tax=Genypterus blacodes TaxID=154954 RepID=UPI003F77491E
MYLSASKVCLQIIFLTFLVFSASGNYKVTISSEAGVTVTFRRVKVSKCEVCTGSGLMQCHHGPTIPIQDEKTLSLQFTCHRPQDEYTVDIQRTIECTSKACSDHIVLDEFGFFPLMDFNRTFTWKLNATGSQAFRVDFGKTGLRQVDPSESCPDRHTYGLRAFQSTGEVDIGTYCRTGFIRSAQILNQGSFTVDIKAGQKLQQLTFDVSVGEDIKSLAKLMQVLPRGTSTFTLLSPNYPNSFPDDDLMEWDFQVPAKQVTEVQFLNPEQPLCLKKETAVEILREGRRGEVRRLSDPQLIQTRGNFLMTLKNCEMDRRRSSAPGLSVSFRVSARSTSSPVLCSVNLRKAKDLSFYIEKLGTYDDCVMKVNSAIRPKISLPSGSVTELTFQDCLPEDVKVSATRVIACSQLKDCPKSPVSLRLPLLPACLPAPLSAVTWILRAPSHGTVELRSPPSGLRQSLPGQTCNDSVTVHVVEGDGKTVGQFCSQGAIQKIKIHANMSVTVSSVDGKQLGLYAQSALSVSLTGEISESYIFLVSPKKDLPVLLATPGWPNGMKSYSTASWIVSVPPKMEAHMMFPNLSQPKCIKRHTNIKVQRIGSPEEDYSRREDEEAESKIIVPTNFYLNMSNCLPEKGDFSVITQITLQKSTNRLHTIVLCVVAVLLVICAAVLAVVCVVTRRKKKQMEHQVSIYNPNGTSFQAQRDKMVEDDDESHIYASIEDSMVYTHLLRKGAEMGLYGETKSYKHSTEPPARGMSGADDLEVSVYQPFPGVSQPPPTLPIRPLSHKNLMVDNEIYLSQEELRPGLTEIRQRPEPEGGN